MNSVQPEKITVTPCPTIEEIPTTIVVTDCLLLNCGKCSCLIWVTPANAYIARLGDTRLRCRTCCKELVTSGAPLTITHNT